MAKPIIVDEKNLVAYFMAEDITQDLIDEWGHKGKGYMVAEFREENG